jgi:hypothetical protein
MTSPAAAAVLKKYYPAAKHELQLWTAPSLEKVSSPRGDNGLRNFGTDYFQKLTIWGFLLHLKGCRSTGHAGPTGSSLGSSKRLAKSLRNPHLANRLMHITCKGVG